MTRQLERLASIPNPSEAMARIASNPELAASMLSEVIVSRADELEILRDLAAVSTDTRWLAGLIELARHVRKSLWYCLFLAIFYPLSVQAEAGLLRFVAKVAVSW